jgi:hypothetical protein
MATLPPLEVRKLTIEDPLDEIRREDSASLTTGQADAGIVPALLSADESNAWSTTALTVGGALGSRKSASAAGHRAFPGASTGGARCHRASTPCEARAPLPQQTPVPTFDL